MDKVWKITPRKKEDLITQLLLNRGIKTAEEKEDFFNPDLKDYEKDFKLSGIQNAKKRIEQAVKNKELVFIYGDYDVDGVCGAAIFYLGLTDIGAKVFPYIPHREKEGYGLSKTGLDLAKEKDAGLIITVDCGITSFEEINYAKKLGLDVIVSDHHQTEDGRRPKALQIIHSDKLSGSAVGWCLVRSLIDEHLSEELLEFVSVATISDMMPLLGVNRALTKIGLEKLNQTKRPGWLALFREARVEKGSISSYEVGHLISPRLNAMGRLEHAIDSLRLLCTKDVIKAAKLASLVGETNNKRKQLTLEAMEMSKLQITDGKKINVLSDSNWVPGIIGLVAGRVAETTGKPSVVISIGPQQSKGSARSNNGINIVEVIRKCSDLLIDVGGHAGAAGFTVATSKIEEFKIRLESLMEEDVIREEPVLNIEAQVKEKELTMSLAKQLEEFEPFGLGNPKPILATLNMQLSDLRTVGENKHLKGNIILDFTTKGRKVPFIAFSMGSIKEVLKEGQLVDLAYTLEVDHFNGSQKVQLKIKDLKVKG